jgi:glutathione S-transferase
MNLVLIMNLKQFKLSPKKGWTNLQHILLTRRVPVLVDGTNVIWDSHLIAKYLFEKQNQKLPELEEEKEINLINEANDSGIILYQLKYFSLDNGGENTFSKLHYKRLKGILTHFDEKLANEALGWGLVASYLYCMLDWFSFREVFPWERFSHLKKFYDVLKDKEVIQQTAP